VNRTTLAVVIANYNTRDYLARCLESIERYPPDFPFEVIVVDNNSHDGSAEMVRQTFPRVRLLANPDNVGFGPALNQGARASESDYVLLLNSDTEMLPGTLALPIREMERRPRVGMVAPEFVDRNGEIIQMSWGWTPLFLGEILQRIFSPRAVQEKPWRRRMVQRLQAKERLVPTLCGAAMFVRRQALESAGGMDEGFVLYFEDSDICVRIRQQGWNLLLLPKVRIIHHLGKSTVSRPGKMALIYRQSQLRFYRKHGSPVDRILLRLYLRWKFRQVYVAAERQKPEHLREHYRALRGVLSGTEHIGL